MRYNEKIENNINKIENIYNLYFIQKYKIELKKNFIVKNKNKITLRKKNKKVGENFKRLSPNKFEY
jgi:hypothetical protein